MLYCKFEIYCFLWEMLICFGYFEIDLVFLIGYVIYYVVFSEKLLIFDELVVVFSKIIE